MPSRDSAAGGIPRPDSREGGDRRAETRWLPRVRRTARGKRSIVARVVARQPGPGTRTGSRRASGGHARSRRPSAAPSGATLRALRAARHSTALPAMQHRIDPVRRLLAASHGVFRVNGCQIGIGYLARSVRSPRPELFRRTWSQDQINLTSGRRVVAANQYPAFDGC